MKVLLTGAAGFIGSNLAEYLAKNNVSVRAVDCFLPDSYDSKLKIKNWEVLKSYSNVELVVSDLREKLPNGLLKEIDVVINEAAMPGLMKSWSDFNLYSTCNLNLVENLARESVKENIKHFIQISTSSVYGLNAIGNEESKLAPVSPYGVTKLAAEELIKSFGRSLGLGFTILRYFSVYGPRQRPDMAYHKLIASALTGRPIEVYGDGKQSRSNTYIQDCVSATFQAIIRKPNSEVINIAGGESRTLLEAINIIQEHLDKKINVIHKDKRPGDQLHTKGDIEKARRLLNYQPKFSLEIGLAQQVKWQANSIQ